MLTFKGAIGDSGDNRIEAVRAIQREPKVPWETVKERTQNKGTVNPVTWDRYKAEGEDREKAN